MFEKNTMVAWATRQNTFMGKVIESNENTSVVLVISTAKGRKYDGKKMSVSNDHLGNISNGRTVVSRIQN